MSTRSVPARLAVLCTVILALLGGGATAAQAAPLNDPVVGIAATPAGRGYWLAAADGGVFAYGDARFHGSMAGKALAGPVVGIAATPDGGGYWLTAADGGVFAFGDAGFFGGMAGRALAGPVVGIAATPDGGGYWLTAADGGVFAFGDAGFFGGMAGRALAGPVVGIAATPDGGGYWLTAADGGVFAFGDAGFHGGMAGKALNKPVVGIAATASGGGYWLTAADGGVFAFGDARFRGSMAQGALAYPLSGIVRSTGSDGYWLTAGDGGVFSFGSAQFYGSHGGQGVAARTLWGVDTTDNLTATNTLGRVRTELGQPDFVGRYLDFGTGLSAAEVGAVHAAGARLLLISSPRSSRLLGAALGTSDGAAAVAAGRAVGVPVGKAIFRNVEQGYPIDAAYVGSWVGAVRAAGYVPGFYENPINGRFPAAFCDARTTGVVLFSAQPGRQGVSVARRDAPPYQPDTPPCANTTVAWQYEIKGLFPAGNHPNVDLDLMDGSRAVLLW